MADLTDADLELIRDEVGTTDPTDDALYDMFDDLGHWLLVALRVLKRRRAAATQGGSTAESFTLTGVLSVGMSKTSLAALDAQIAALEAQYAALTPAEEDLQVGAGFVTRAGARDRWTY